MLKVVVWTTLNFYKKGTAPSPEAHELQSLQTSDLLFFLAKTLYFEKYHLIRNNLHKIFYKKGSHQVFCKLNRRQGCINNEE